ncbi:MAG: ATP-binding protein [Promethearchaeota archaeon]
MKRLNFPFTAIIGQDRMRKALILNVIDPKIGGVLLTGHQGTGKSTAVRSLADILPEIEAIEGCPFSCDPHDDPDNLCDSCRRKVLEEPEKIKIVKKPISLVDLPLGVTEDMVCGSLDLEKVLKEGKKVLHPGLLAKANRGILYIDEINLLQDHIVDILLDSAASGVNIIEREGVSISHPARFILVGSMNPEEGELRPQINDRLGLEVTIDAPTDPKIRAEITKRVMEFNDDPKGFIEKYKDKQEELKQKIIKARKILKDVEVPQEIYEFVASVVEKLGIKSQRADITFVRCARAAAAFRGSMKVEMIDLDGAIDLVFEHRLRALRDDIEPEEIEDKIQQIFGEIKEAYESTKAYKPAREQDGPLKSNNEPQTEFKRQPFDPEKMADLPENDQKVPDNPDIDDWDRIQSEGMKVTHDRAPNKFSIDDLKPVADLFQKKMINIMKLIRIRRKKMDFAGRGSRTKITSSRKGRYITYKFPVGKPNSIAFDVSIKKSLVRQLCIDSAPLYGDDLNGAGAPAMSFNMGQIADSTLISDSATYIPQSHSYTPALNNNSNKNSCNSVGLTFPIRMEKDDIVEKVYEFKAPMSIYFILDASGSMARYIRQMAEVIKSVHKEGYEKKDKMSVIVFKGKKSHILQRSTTNLVRVLNKLPSIKGNSYTPLADALTTAENMIKAEKMKNKDIIPVVFICSDLGANISLKYPDLRAQTQEEFNMIADELKEIAKRFGRNQIKTIIMIPKKGRAIRYLGVNPIAIENIKDAFRHYASAQIFEFDGYNPKKTIINLKKIL